ncbi:MAG: hypothetical protein VKJ64_12755 [Leptolyngbyaceae bacterium]|nr:hypothetical protein [Leptolyngbyaceae bacterium]
MIANSRGREAIAPRTTDNHSYLFLPRFMPLVLLVILLMIGVGLTDILAYAPLGVLGWLHIPQWLGLGFLGIVMAWIIGDD